MKKKSIVIILVVAALGVVLLVLSFKSNGSEATEEIVNEARYYALPEGNIFLKLAKACDDFCYYLTDSIIGGISSLFSLFLG